MLRLTLLHATKPNNVADTQAVLLARLLLEDQVIDGAQLVSITGKYAIVLVLTTMRMSPCNIAASVRNSSLFLLPALLSVAGASSLVDAKTCTSSIVTSKDCAITTHHVRCLSSTGMGATREMC